MMRANEMTNEATVDEAHRILRREYFDAVRSICDDVRSEIENGTIENEDDVTDYLHVSVDGNHYVIYTFANFEVLRYSDNGSAFVDDFGDEGLVVDGCVNWAALAYCAMLADVREHLGDLDDLFESEDDA